MMYAVTRIPYDDKKFLFNLGEPWRSPSDDTRLVRGMLVGADTPIEARKIFFDFIYDEFIASEEALRELIVHVMTVEGRDGERLPVILDDPSFWRKFYDKEDADILNAVEMEFSVLLDKGIEEVWKDVYELLQKMSPEALKKYCFSSMESHLGVIQVDEVVVKKE